MASEIVICVVQHTVCIGPTVAEGIDADATKPTGRPGCEGGGNLCGFQ